MLSSTAPHEPISSSLRTVTRAIYPYLQEARVFEIMLNPDGHVWVDRAGEGKPSLTETTMTPAEAEAFLRFVATESGTTLNREHPTLAGTLPHWEQSSNHRPDRAEVVPYDFTVYRVTPTL